MKKRIRKTIHWRLKKYGRFFRLYLKRVRRTEREIGGELQAC